jgi:hypothetical protein
MNGDSVTPFVTESPFTVARLGFRRDRLTTATGRRTCPWRITAGEADRLRRRLGRRFQLLGGGLGLTAVIGPPDKQSSSEPRVS